MFLLLLLFVCLLFRKIGGTGCGGKRGAERDGEEVEIKAMGERRKKKRKKKDKEEDGKRVWGGEITKCHSGEERTIHIVY